MRLLIFFLLFSGVCQAQGILSKPVSLSLKTGTVEEVLTELNAIDGINISYSSEVIDGTKKILLSGKEKTVQDVLDVILKGQRVKYVEQSGKIFIVATSPLKKKFTVSGYIIDKKTGERLIGASIYSLSKKAGTVSNNYGFYSITFEEDSLDLYTTYTGFHPFVTRFYLGADLSRNVELDEVVVLNPVVVISSEGSRNMTRAAGKTEVTKDFIQSMPSLMAEADVMKTLQLLPGVQAGNEGSSGLNVRGGSADQNLILLDGVTVYNASHAFGLFSIFNSDAVHNVEILKSGFPASYGGRLSSVVDVHMKEGDKYKFHGEGGVGLIFSKLTLEGPLKKGQSSFMVSARRTYFDLLLKPIVNLSNSDTEVVPFFSDINVKANFPAGKNNRVYFSLYSGKDKFRETTEFENTTPSETVRSIQTYGFSWGNITAMMRWNHVFNKKTFSNFTFTHSRYRFRTQDEEKILSDKKPYELLRTQHYFSGIQDWNFKADIDYRPVPGHYIKTGFAATVHRYQPGVNKFFQRDSVVKLNSRIDNHSLTAGEYDVYVEDDIRLSAKMKMNAGLRFSAFHVQGKWFASLQPRLNWLYKLNNEWMLKASLVRMNQFIHLLTNGNLGLPTDLWLPVTRKLPPQVSNQVSGGISFRPQKTMEVSMEVYYKSLENVIEYSEGLGFTNAYNTWDNIVEKGTGSTYGAEWWVQKKLGKMSGMFSYTLSKSSRKFASINNGRSFPYKYDRRHEIKFSLAGEVRKNFECGVNWYFASGNAISLPIAYYLDPISGSFVDVYEGRNDFRMPAYHRLDVSMKFSKQKKRHVRSWVFSVYNVYNRFNPFFRYKAYNASNVPVFKEIAVFPFLPSFAWQFKF